MLCFRHDNGATGARSPLRAEASMKNRYCINHVVLDASASAEIRFMNITSSTKKPKPPQKSLKTVPVAAQPIELAVKLRPNGQE